MRWKDYFYFSPIEKIAVLILLVIILLSFGLNVLLSNRSSRTISIPKNDSLIVAFERLQKSIEAEKTKPSDYGRTPIRNNHRKEINEKLSKSNKIKKTEDITDKPAFEKQTKFTKPQSISLNETNIEEWQKVPGIGTTFSHRIVKYGKLLGGYISINQLKEVYGFTDEMFNEIKSFIKEDNQNNIVKININEAEFKEILAHPYINYEQTKAIINLRKRIGAIQSINQLSMLKEFSAKDIEKITPYVQF